MSARDLVWLRGRVDIALAAGPTRDSACLHHVPADVLDDLLHRIEHTPVPDAEYARIWNEAIRAYTRRLAGVLGDLDAFLERMQREAVDLMITKDPAP